MRIPSNSCPLSFGASENVGTMVYLIVIQSPQEVVESASILFQEFRESFNNKYNEVEKRTLAQVSWQAPP